LSKASQSSSFPSAENQTEKRIGDTLALTRKPWPTYPPSGKRCPVIGEVWREDTFKGAVIWVCLSGFVGLSQRRPSRQRVRLRRSLLGSGNRLLRSRRSKSERQRSPACRCCRRARRCPPLKQECMRRMIRDCGIAGLWAFGFAFQVLRRNRVSQHIAQLLLPISQFLVNRSLRCF
jgi:hypothetical protein